MSKILNNMDLKKTKFSIIIIIVAVLAIMATSCGPSPPIIRSYDVPDTVRPGTEHLFTAEVYDPDSGNIEITWEIDGNVEGGGNLNRNTGDKVIWQAPSKESNVFLTITATDDDGATDVITKDIFVRNKNPKITSFSASPDDIVLIGNTITLNCEAIDPENAELDYDFQVLPGGVGEFDDYDHPKGATEWTAPDTKDQTGYYKFIVTVSDDVGFVAKDTIKVLVYSDYGSIWVVDSEIRGPKLKRYTSTGKLIISANQELVEPKAVSNNYRDDCSAWVADYSAGTIYKVGPLGATKVTIDNVPQVLELDMYKQNHQLVALSRGQETITLIDGFSKTKIKTITGFEKPRYMDINQENGDIWVSEPTNNRVVKFNIENPPDSVSLPPDSVGTEDLKFEYLKEDLTNPRGVAVGDITPTSVYIADKNEDQIEKVRKTVGGWERSEMNSSNLSPEIIKAATSTQNVWIIGGGDVYYFNEQNENIIPLNPGDFSSPETMDIDEEGDVWVGDNGLKKLLKVDRNGVVFSTEGFHQIEDIVVNK